MIYNETTSAEPTSRLLPDHQRDLIEWYGYGTVGGEPARAVYMTTEDDAHAVEDVGGDWGVVDWRARLVRVETLDEHGDVIRAHDAADVVIE